jgi:hypothetical protein
MLRPEFYAKMGSNGFERVPIYNPLWVMGWVLGPDLEPMMGFAEV